MSCVVPILGLLLTGPARVEADDPVVPLVKVTVAAGKAAPRALRYPLLPEPLDQTPGNAALLWLRAARAAAGPAGKMTEKQHEEWVGGDKPLKDLSRVEIRKFLDTARTALLLADRAARCERCDWDQGPLTFQNVQSFLDPMLEDVQGLRALASLLSVQFRLQLIEGDYDGAARTIQTGLTLGRQLGQGPTMIQSLVGIAITGIAVGQIEQWVSTPGAPNLYWSLTALPTPLIDVRSSIRYELDSVYRSYPALRRLERETMDAKKIQSLVEELFESVCKLEGSAPTGWESKLGLGVLAARAYPDAKKYLLDEGEDKARIEAMPVLQVVMLHLLRQYDRQRDDTLKWLSVPYWQGREPLEAITREAQARLKDSPGHLLMYMLSPAVVKVHAASVRVARHAAALRCLEAVRLYAAAHRGKLPEKLSDVKPLPLPLDPVTGESFDAVYRKDGGKAVFELRAVPGQGTFTPRRYELSEK
jgi:hypothetical protein